MNTDRVRYLADSIEKYAADYPEHFNMADFSRPVGADMTVEDYRRHVAGVAPWKCGTVACIAGFVPFVFDAPVPAASSWSAHALNVLGAHADDRWRAELEDLFHGGHPLMSHLPLEEITAETAAAALRELADRYDRETST
jgi:hypothetical protein